MSVDADNFVTIVARAAEISTIIESLKVLRENV